ncbi:MAG: hypothetical protein Q8911_09125 [Bacillota bacterium]|nr:hypothetical protein [Bacillota bacterium]
MKFGGDNPSEPYEPNEPNEPIEPQGFPMQLPNSQLGSGYSAGSIRNTLGSGLKASGFFQKDGKVQNLRGGFIGPKQPPTQGPLWQPPLSAQGRGYTQEQGYDQGMVNKKGYYQGGYGQGQVYNQVQTRQLILQPAQEGINGNGAATISPDNIFLLIANLPAPQTFLRQGQPGVYAAYLVDDKGTSGFLVGLLRSVGNGVYRAHFQSPVPLHHYSRVVVSVENPSMLGQAPFGPIILKVKEPIGMMTFLTPVKNAGSTVWGKISGLISGRKKPQIGPETVPMNQEFIQSTNPMGDMSEMAAPPVPPVSMAPMAPMNPMNPPVPPTNPIPPTPQS